MMDEWIRNMKRKEEEGKKRIVEGESERGKRMEGSMGWRNWKHEKKEREGKEKRRLEGKKVELKE